MNHYKFKKMINRPLFIDFSLYAHDDPDFKQELIALMVKDLQELQSSLQLSMQLNEISLYRKACHKMNSTLNILGDKEFLDIVEEIKLDNTPGEKVAFFTRMCTEIINSLELDRTGKNNESNPLI